ncbi:MAG: VPLPA-CTERM sorting domain-containing protein [Pseudomonadota bacterium]
MLRTTFAAVAVIALWAGAASASTISISSFSVSSYNSLLGTLDDVVSEDFEDATVGNVSQGFMTDVGDFSTLGGTGSGGTVSNANFSNNGSLLAIRDGNVYGRTSTTRLLTGNAADDQFLDSNDTFGIEWNVSLSNGAMFDQILLTLSDAADTGASLRVVDNTGSSATLQTASNGSQQVVFVDFGAFVNGATILFENRSSNGFLKNDGFSLDDIAIGTNGVPIDYDVPSPVPLPGAGLLLAAALGGLTVVRRRKAA